MPGCSAFGCSNRGTVNFKFYNFPRDVQRRKEWCVKVGRQDEHGKLWIANDYHRLCNEHFTADQFEPLIPGKLKRSAIPTLFQHRKVQPTRKPPLKRKSTDVPTQSNVLDHCYAAAASNVSSDEPIIDEEGTPDEKLVKLESKMKEVLKENRNLRKKQARCDELESRLSSLFNCDQMESMKRKSSKGMEWSAGTVEKALQLKFACGRTGYELLLEQGQPLPSIRTLTRRLQNIAFESGVLLDVFNLLSVKVKSMNAYEKICSITLDEMALTQKMEYDPSSGRIMGNVNLPGHDGSDIASHALVFMLAGITTRWKQTIAYYCTGDSTKGSVYKDILLKIISKCTEIGLDVVNITSDMGSSNQAMWKAFGVSAKKASAPVFEIDNPFATGKKITFMADVPHLIKNLTSVLINKHTITVGERQISIGPVMALAEFQHKNELKLAPNLKKEKLEKMKHFEKMKVKNALHIISNSVSAGIRYMLDDGNIVMRADERKMAEDTAWFITLMNQWFDLMSSRNHVMALSNLDPAKLEEAMKCLDTVCQVVRQMKVGNGYWKPIQNGIILSTTTVTLLSRRLLCQGMDFIMTARLTQDCLENLFSTVRQGNPVPTSAAFKKALKIITVAQFLKTSRHSSYDTDDSSYLASYLSAGQSSDEEDIVMPQEVIVLTEKDDEVLSMAEKNSLYYLIGWALKRINRECNVCAQLQCSAPVPELTAQSKLTRLKEYQENSLRHPSLLTYAHMYKVEQCFRR